MISPGPAGWALLDRDGTIIEECPYISDPERVRLIPGAAQAIREMRTAGVVTAVVTNQSAVERGYFTIQRLDEVHERLLQLLQEEGADLDGIFFCPHLPDAGCQCRKPAPGLLLQAVERFRIDRERCFLIGDRQTDIEAGRRASVQTVLVRTGYGRVQESMAGADHVCDDLGQAAKLVLRELFS